MVITHSSLLLPVLFLSKLIFSTNTNTSTSDPRLMRMTMTMMEDTKNEWSPVIIDQDNFSSSSSEEKNSSLNNSTTTTTSSQDLRKEGRIIIVKSNFACPKVNRYRLTHVGQHLTILSPNYPLQYPLQLTCRYHISSPVRTRLFMTCKIALPHHHLKCPKTGDQFQYSLSGDETLSQQNSFRLCGHYILKTFTTSNRLSIGFRSGPLNLYSLLPTLRHFKCKIKVIKNHKFGISSSDSSCGIRNFGGVRSTSTPMSNRNRTGSTKIIGGMMAGNGEFPWRCALQVIKNGMVARTCTCSIISNGWILTSVHCTLNEVPADIFIRVGTSSFTNTGGPPLPVSVINRHASYGGGQNDDVAVVKLTTPLVYSSTVSPICLPCPYKGQQFIENPVTVSGWVESPAMSGMHNLLYKDLQVMNRMVCRAIVPINMDEICTYEPGKMDCMEMGDSGSFADYMDPATGVYYAAGIYSWNRVCMSQTMPAVQQNVARFIDWIEQNTGEKYC